jgi:hypothetical protein
VKRASLDFKFLSAGLMPCHDYPHLRYLSRFTGAAISATCIVDIRYEETDLVTGAERCGMLCGIQPESTKYLLIAGIRLRQQPWKRKRLRAGLVVRDNLLNLFDKRGQIFADSIPEYIEIDIEVTMDKPVA